MSHMRSKWSQEKSTDEGVSGGGGGHREEDDDIRDDGGPQLLVETVPHHSRECCWPVATIRAGDWGHALVVYVKVAVPVDPVERDELLGLQAVDEISIKGQERRQEEGLCAYVAAKVHGAEDAHAEVDEHGGCAAHRKYHKQLE
jgi:hypothetical protein